MTTASAWILVAAPVWHGRPEVVGVYPDRQALDAAAEERRGLSCVRSQDELTAQRWVGQEMVEEISL